LPDERAQLFTAEEIPELLTELGDRLGVARRGGGRLYGRRDGDSL
jgi:hypothetical protein